MYDENTKREIARLVETQRELRGHDFLPDDAELAKIPGRYDTEDVRESFKKVHLHYTVPSADWWLVEVWQEDAGSETEPPLWMGFGYTRFASMPDGAEWGYVSLNELEELNVRPPLPAPPPYPQAYIAIVPQIIVERDLNWTPKFAHECIPGIPAPADDHGYPWVLAFERLHDEYNSEAEMEAACKAAADARAPEGSYRFEDGEWKTIDRASSALRELLEAHVKAVADDE